jgi:cobalt-zinc-cadmium efflux system outer membrane protein
MTATDYRLRTTGQRCVPVSLYVRRGLGVVAWLIASVGPAANAFAQETSVEQLVATALERSPDIRAARTAIAAASGAVTQAGLRPNPTFTGSQMLRTGAQHQTLFEVDWPLDLSRRDARVGAAQRGVEAATLAVQDRERGLAADVRQQAGRLLAARRTVEITTESLTTARRMRELLDAKVTEGYTPKLDANIAAVEAGRLEADLAIAQADAEAAAIELKALIGLAPTEPLVLRESLEMLVRTNDDAAPQAAASVAARPDVRAAASRVTLADARVEAARREGRTDVTLVGNYGREGYGFSQRGFDETGRLVPVEGKFHSLTVGARLQLPLRNKNQGAVATALAQRTADEQMLAARQLIAQAELDAAVVRDREARRAMDMYATSIRDLARQNVEVQLEAYDLGRTPLNDVLTEQRRYLDVEAGYTSVLRRAWDTRVALRSARGEIR